MAYTNFTNCTKEQYETIIYSQGAKNKLKIWFNNVELQDADRYCEKLTRKTRVLTEDGSKRFSLDNFLTQEITLILHNINQDIIQDKVRISIGTLVSQNTYEYVPLGTFNIQNIPTTDKDKITIKLRDNAVLFDFPYNAKPLIDANGGSATKMQILQDICLQANVSCGVTQFNDMYDLVGIYDNTINGRIYVNELAEQSGLVAIIDRDGVLQFVNLNGEEQDLSIQGSATIPNATSTKLLNFEMLGATSQNGTPTPTTPVDVEVVTGRQTIDLCGSNVFDKSKIVTTSARNTILSQLDTGVRATFTGTSSGTYRWQYYRIPNSKCYFGKTYTLYSNISASANNNGQVVFWQINTNGDAVGNRIGTALTSSGSITVTFPNSFETGASDFAILFYSNMNGTVAQNDYVDYTNVKLEYGTQATEYEAFNGNTYEINLGKNLYDPSFRRSGLSPIYSNNCTATEENGIFTLVATGSDMFIWGARNTGDTYDTMRGKLYEFESDNYIVTVSNSTFNKNFVTFYDENKVSLGYINKSSNVFTFSKNDKTGAKYFTLRFGYGSAVSGTTYEFTVQMEKGTQATSYAKYKTPIELCRIDNYQDKIYKSNNKWYIEKQIAKITLTGEENWQKINLAFQVGSSVSPNKGDVSLNAYSNYYKHKYYSSGITFSIQNNEFGWNSSKALTIRNDSCSNASDFKTWLANNKTNIYYVVDTPTTEEITDIELIEQLNAIDLLYGINNIMISSGDLTSTINTKYYNQRESIKIPLNVVEKYELGTPYKIERVVYEDGIRKYETSNDDTLPTLYINSANHYITKQSQIDYIYNLLKDYEIDSIKTGKVLGNPAIDNYDIVEIYGYYETLPNGNKRFVADTNTIVAKTLANHTFTYKGTMINEITTEIGLEERKENVTIKNEGTYKKIVQTEIDDINGSITTLTEETRNSDNNIVQQIEGVKTTQDAQARTIEIFSTNIDPNTGDVKSVKTIKGYTFDAEGLKISTSEDTFNSLHDNTGSYYKDGDTILTQFTKQNTIVKDLVLYGNYYYGVDKDLDVANFTKDDAMFVAEKYTDNNNEVGFGHFYNGGDL